MQTHNAKDTDPALVELGYPIQDSCRQAHLELLGVHPATWSSMSFYNDDPMTLCLQLPGCRQSCRFSTALCDKYCCLQMSPRNSICCAVYLAALKVILPIGM